MEPEQMMQMAIDVARRGITDGQSPFGCAIARDDQVLSARHNTVWGTMDITAHAEVNALRAACQQTGEIVLSGSVAATTCEPCPMCISALHWARIDTVFFGASIADAAQAGFNGLNVTSQQLVTLGGSPLRVVAGLMAAECRRLFEEWLQGPRQQAN